MGTRCCTQSLTASLLSSVGGRSITFHMTAPVAGTYALHLSNPGNSNRAQAATFVVTDADSKQTTLTVDQRVSLNLVSIGEAVVSSPT